MPSTSATYRVQIQDVNSSISTVEIDIWGRKTTSWARIQFESDVLDQLWICKYCVSCAEYTKDFIHHLNKNDEHSLDEARVNIPLRNSPSFAKDFHCHSGSRMNPKQKCNVW
ncbi:Neprilysin-1 [Nymphon striatum]|nr:Neprilysin-1 [Nymphon striatum]